MMQTTWLELRNTYPRGQVIRLSCDYCGYEFTFVWVRRIHWKSATVIVADSLQETADKPLRRIDFDAISFREYSWHGGCEGVKKWYGPPVTDLTV